MTIYMKLTRLTLTLVGATALTLTLPAVSAMASEASAQFQVTSTTDGRIKLGVRAFNKGDYAKSIRLNEAALASKLSPKKSAIAYSNICASHGALGHVAKAKEACAAALELRSDYAPAQHNNKALSKVKPTKK